MRAHRRRRQRRRTLGSARARLAGHRPRRRARLQATSMTCWSASSASRGSRRHWVHDDLELAVEVPGWVLEPARRGGRDDRRHPRDQPRGPRFSTASTQWHATGAYEAWRQACAAARAPALDADLLGAALLRSAPLLRSAAVRVLATMAAGGRVRRPAAEPRGRTTALERGGIAGSPCRARAAERSRRERPVSSRAHDAGRSRELPAAVRPRGLRQARPTVRPTCASTCGVAIVGAGPAGLACAIRLGQLLGDDPATLEQLGEVPIIVLEKGRSAGSHELSGAIVNPSALARAVPGRRRSSSCRRTGR